MDAFDSRACTIAGFAFAVGVRLPGEEAALLIGEIDLDQPEDQVFAQIRFALRGRGYLPRDIVDQ